MNIMNRYIYYWVFSHNLRIHDFSRVVKRIRLCAALLDDVILLLAENAGAEYRAFVEKVLATSTH